MQLEHGHHSGLGMDALAAEHSWNMGDMRLEHGRFCGFGMDAGNRTQLEHGRCYGFACILS